MWWTATAPVDPELRALASRVGPVEVVPADVAAAQSGRPGVAIVDATAVDLAATLRGRGAWVIGLGAGAAVCDDHVRGGSTGEIVARIELGARLAQAQEASARRERAIRSEVEEALDRLTDGFFAVDRQFRVTWLNRRAFEMLVTRSSGAPPGGRSTVERLVEGRKKPGPAARSRTWTRREELIGKPITEGIEPAEHSGFRDRYREAMDRQVPVVFEDYYPPFDLWTEVHAYPSPDGLSVFVTDITARKRAELELGVERERLQVTLRSIADAVFTSDTNGCVESMNELAEELCGVAGVDARGRPLGEVLLLLDEKTRAPIDFIGQAIRGRIEASGVVATGDVDRFVSCTAAPIAFRDRVIGVVVVARDMTRWRRMEDQLARTGRMEAIGVLAGGIAHEFNNLLTSVLGNVSLAAMYLEAGSPAQGALEDAELACERARGLTSRLLTFASGGAPVKAAVDLAPLVREEAAAAAGGLPIDLVVRVPDALPLEADPTQLRQVLWHLVRNACEASPKGGRVVVTAEADSEHVGIAVSDEGPGIPPELRERVFDPFFSTRPGGAGLGLATAFSIVRRHGGTIDIEGRPGGRGTVASVRLPRGPRSPVAPSPSPSPSRVGRRVLVMDDEEMLRRLAQELLGELGYDVDVAENGSAAVSRVTDALAQGRPYAAAILDLTIPGGMGGLEAAQRIRAVDPGVRCVVSSGYSTDAVLANPGASGFAAVIPKPYTVRDLDRVLREVIAASPGR